jgi:thymidylate kinase
MSIEAKMEDPRITRNAVHQIVKEQEYKKNQMPQEDASIFLDLNPKIAVALLEKRKEKLKDEDEYTDHIEIQQRLYNEYDLLYSDEPEHYIRIKCTEGEKLLGIADIAELVWAALRQKFPHLINK